MPTLDPRIDAYIAQSPDFAQPILANLRAAVHAACPDVQETMKWSCPHFEYKGLLCGMASFKAHCKLNFWKAALMFPGTKEGEATAPFTHLASVKELPSKSVLAGYVRQAMKLNEEGASTPARTRPAPPPPLIVPDYFAAALQGDKAAQTVFDTASPSFRREYVAWLADAKTEATRLRRMAQAVEWIAEGKARNWKYEKC
jgi:hypothetical protein